MPIYKLCADLVWQLSIHYFRLLLIGMHSDGKWPMRLWYIDIKVMQMHMHGGILACELHFFYIFTCLCF
jgi:hypothetical protein